MPSIDTIAMRELVTALVLLFGLVCLLLTLMASSSRVCKPGQLMEWER